MAKDKRPIVAIDPGNEKCGVAIVYLDQVLMREIVARGDVVERLRAVLPKAGPIVVGDGTGSKAFIQELIGAMPQAEGRIVTIDENVPVLRRGLYTGASTRPEVGVGCCRFPTDTSSSNRRLCSRYSGSTLSGWKIRISDKDL